jgi:cytoskeletal protein CcmA (bactofilin family)
MSPVENSTVIGKSVIVRGELSGNEDLIMDGDLEGSITLSESKLTIGPNARVIANINVRDLVVFGKLTGNVIASGRIELRQTAVVSGDIVASRLSIEESAVLQGRVDLTGTGAKAAAPALPGATPATPPAATLFASEPKA